MTKPIPFKWFKTSHEIIRLPVVMYVRFPLSLRNVVDLLHKRGVELSHRVLRCRTLSSFDTATTVPSLP